jgi:hypothetical protein
MKNKLFFIFLTIIILSCNKDDFDKDFIKPTINIQETLIGHEKIKIKSVLRNYDLAKNAGIIWERIGEPLNKEILLFENLLDTVELQIEGLDFGTEYNFKGFITHEDDTIFSDIRKIKTGNLELVNELVYSLDLAYYDRGVVVFETSDGGFVTGGYSINYFGNSENKILLKKISSDFENVWELVIEDFFSIKKIIEGPNNDLLVLIDGHGYGKAHPILYRINSNGTIIWKKQYEKSEVDFLNDMLLFDNELYLIGRSSSTSSDERKGWFLKLDLNGNILSDKLYPYETFMVGKSLAVLDNKLYGIGGAEDNEHPVFASLDLNGNLLSSYKIGSSHDNVTDMVVVGDEFIVNGITRRIGPGDSTNLWVFKINKSGSLIWEKGIGKSKWSFSLVTTSTNMDKDSNNNILFTGIGGPGSPRMHTNLFLTKINSVSGEEIWHRDFGSDQNYTYEGGFGLIVKENDNIVVLGQKEDEEENTISMTTDVWLQEFYNR